MQSAVAYLLYGNSWWLLQHTNCLILGLQEGSHIVSTIGTIHSLVLRGPMMQWSVIFWACNSPAAAGAAVIAGAGADKLTSTDGPTVRLVRSSVCHQATRHWSLTGQPLVTARTVWHQGDVDDFQWVCHWGDITLLWRVGAWGVIVAFVRWHSAMHRTYGHGLGLGLWSVVR